MKKLLLCIWLALAIPAHPQAADNDDTSVAITKLREGLIESFNSGDIDKLVSYLAPDAVITWQNGEVCTGPQEVKAYCERMMKGDHRVVREVKAAPEIIGRHIYGDWGVSWGNLHDRFVLMDGRDLQMNSGFTATIAKRGDRWVIVAYHVSVNAFDNPVTNLAVHKTALWLGSGGAAAGVLLGFVIAGVLRKKNSAVST